MMYRSGLAWLVISTVLMVDGSSVIAARWGTLKGDSQLDGASPTEHRCVQILQVKAGEFQTQEISFSSPAADLELAVLTLRENDYAQAIGAPLYVETLIYNEGRVDVIRSWLHNRVCR